MIINGNSLIELKKLPENSVDSVVTDPPYGLSFMGKKWDYDVPSVELWKEVYRVLKPGGHLLSFAGSRTYHRMAVNIEDAGFEIRDQIMWVYGSGFPKSHNIGKAVDKLQGNEREVEKHHIQSQTNPDIHAGGSVHITMPNNWSVTKGTSEYEGWGTALKPAHEPICMARKPLSEKTVAKNVLKWGTGGINIDGCRIPTSENRNREQKAGPLPIEYGFNNNSMGNRFVELSPLGRFPANFIHDGSDEVTELLGEPARFFYCAKASKKDRNEGCEGLAGEHNNPIHKNNHPTVKPTKLMQYLVRLVTRKGGTVLDPFMGSGSTGKACKLEGMEFIGIELDPEYCKISEARINSCNKM